MNCKKCQRLLVDLLYDELSPRRRRKVEAHLKGCPACAREYEALKSTRRVFAQLDEPSPSPEVETRIKAAAREETEAQVSASWWGVIFHPAFATAALVFLVVGILLFQMQEDKPLPQQTALSGLEREHELKKEEIDQVEAFGYIDEDRKGAGKDTVLRSKPAAPSVPADDKKLKVRATVLKKAAPSLSPAEPVKAEIEIMVEGKQAIVVSAELAEKVPSPAARVGEISDREDTIADSAPEESSARVTAPRALPASGAKAGGAGESLSRKKSYSPHVVTYSKESQLETARRAEAGEDWKKAKAVYLNMLPGLSIFDPYRARVIYNLAVCHIHLEEYKQAQYRLEQLLKEHKEFDKQDDALFHLADVYSRQRQIEKARAVYQQINERYPSRTEEVQEKLEAVREEGKD